MFENKGFYKDYYLNDKFIGSQKAEKDRETMGYYGRKKETTTKPIIFSKSKKIKQGIEVTTELNMLCGSIIRN